MAEKKEEGKEEKKQERQDRKVGGSNVSSIVRISGRDVNGALSIERAMHMVKGVGSNLSYALSNAIESKLGISRTVNVGSLSEEQIASIEQVIKEPGKYGVPGYMLNHNKDGETGMAMHTVSNDLLFATRQDINRDVAVKDWRGLRHQYGQKVRGQHTRSTGRTGATVGVTKKAVKEAQKAAIAGEKKKPGKEGAAGAAPAGGAAAPAAAVPAPAKEEKK